MTLRTSYDLYFLPAAHHNVDLEGGKISPILTSEEVQSFVEEYRDSYDWISIARPGNSMFKLPPTHRLELAIDDDPDRLLAGVLIHTLGFMHGTRLQFADWWTDLSVRAKPRAPFSFLHSEVGLALSIALNTASAIDVKKRRGLRNLLRLYTRVDAYKWFWERYLMTYTCLDACWRMLCERGDLPSAPANCRGAHARRIGIMCEDLAIPIADEVDVGKLIAIRNDLVHEGVWMADEPGSGMRDTSEGLHQLLILQALVARLICFVLRIDCAFRTHPWKRSMVPAQFGLLRPNP